MKIIARVRSPFPEKFGIPRQSGLSEIPAKIVFEPEYRVPEAFRGLDGFSHIWIIWGFSETEHSGWTPTVRPPKLGGNKRVGVFATRSPFRPNPIGLSSVRLERIDYEDSESPVLYISGADIMDGTPVYDIKPYLAYTDCHADAAGGFALQDKQGALDVVFGEGTLEKIPQELRKGLAEILSQDPRPGYQHSSERVYIMDFGGTEIKFTVDGKTLTVVSAEKHDPEYIRKK